MSSGADHQLTSVNVRDSKCYVLGLLPILACILLMILYIEGVRPNQ